MPKLDQQLKLPDGRRLGFDEHGPTNGKPLFYFHGSPSSRIEASLYIDENLLERLNVRLIAVDRPGLGLSDFQPNRQMLGWAKDVTSLADHLKLERFSILAYSLGGPYGLACAYAIPDRLDKVGIVSGAALFTESELLMSVNEGTRQFLTMPKEKPWLSRLFLWMMLRLMPRIAPKRFMAQANSLLPAPDYAIIDSSLEFQKGFIKMLHEAMKQGVSGAHHESLLTVTDWGFRIHDIKIPVYIWHGEMDKNIPVEMARFAAKAISNSIAKFFTDEGHLSLFKKNAEEIIKTLVN